MSTDKGYILLYRDIRDHPIWQDKPFAMGGAWIDLLMMANYETRDILFNGRKITVKRGSFITSIKKLSEQWGWSRHKVSDFLDMLTSEGMITNDRDNKKTVINIVNYDKYQDLSFRSRTSKGHQKDITGTSEGHKQYINKYTNKYTKKEKDPASYEAPPPPDEEGTPWSEEGWY